MHLVSCTTPPGSLEAAPRTALFADPSASESDRWDGFWSSQTDGYYARCTHRDGEVEWFSLADDEAVDEPVGAAAHVDALRVDPLKDARDNPGNDATRLRARVTVIVARSPDGRRMLVGSGRRGGGRRA
jgi:hypothetical protein